MATLAASPADSVSIALTTLRDAERAWALARSLDLDDGGTWSTLIEAYEKIDPLVVQPVHERLFTGGLVRADPRNHRAAAQRLRKMRTLASGSDRATDVDAFIAELRDTHRRRPRLQQEFDRAMLPYRSSSSIETRSTTRWKGRRGCLANVPPARNELPVRTPRWCADTSDTPPCGQLRGC